MSDTSKSAAAQFLRALWPDLDGWLLIWGIPSKRSAWFKELGDDVLTTITTMAAKDNVYVGCALRRADLGPTLRGEKADCTAIPGLWLDLDYGSEHKKPNLPETEADAQVLLADMGLAPSVVVQSGRGLQAWWLFKEPWKFDSDEERDEAERLTKGWGSTLRAKAKARGWDADQVGDLPRVMRIPGTWNRKGVPKRVSLLSLDADRRYNPSEFEAYLLAETPKEDAGPKLTWMFELSPLAEPPAEKFMRLCEVDSKFRLSWEHARTDLQDQSASSYDLSLATRAMAAGWSAQELVNLIIAHRRKYMDNPDKAQRRDYLDATLNKAAARKDAEARQKLIEGIRAGEPLPENVKQDPAEILALLSSLLGVTISRFVRYRAEELTYQLELNDRLINNVAIEDLDSQIRFRRMVLSHTDVRIPNFKPDKWGDIVQRLFLAVENVDVTGGTSRSAFSAWLSMYLTDGVKENDWEKAAIDGSPFRLNGAIYICSEPFRMWLRSSAAQTFSQSALSVQMTKLGHVHEVKNVTNSKGKRTRRTLWRICEDAL